MTQLEPDSLVHPMAVQQHQQRSAGAIGLGDRPQHLISFDAHCYPEVPELSGMGSDGAATSPSADPGSKGACSDWGGPFCGSLGSGASSPSPCSSGASDSVGVPPVAGLDDPRPPPVTAEPMLSLIAVLLLTTREYS